MKNKRGRPRKRTVYTVENPPALSPSLVKSYSLLDNKAKRLFNKAYLMLWRSLYNASVGVQGVGSLSLYWSFFSLFSSRSPSLLPSELSVLSFMYYCRGHGVRIIKTEQIYKSDFILIGFTSASKQVVISHLKQKGLIIRYYRNPESPYLKVNISLRPEFIELSELAIKYMQDFEKDIYNMVVRSSLTDLMELTNYKQKQKNPG